MLGRNSGATQDEAPDLDYRLAPHTRLPIAWFETLWMIVWLPGIIRRYRPDILFCAGNSYTIVAVAMKLLFGPSCPPIVAKISNDLSRSDMPPPIRFFYHLWCRVQGQLIRHWIALSPAMGVEAVPLLGIDPTAISVIANPVLDAMSAEALGRAGEQSRASRARGHRFLAAGRLERQKDFGTLIIAFAQGGQPHDRLVIVGEGRMRRSLTRLIRKLALEDRVSLPGHSRTIASHLASSDVLILSSRFEGLPAVVVEAMVAGLHVIATDCCASMRDLIDDETVGTLVPKSSIGAMSLAIATACPNPSPGDVSSRKTGFAVETIARSYRRLFAQISGSGSFEPASPILEEMA